MLQEFIHLVDEVRLLDHKLIQVAEQLHQDQQVTVSERALLEFLLGTGPTTVPDLARARHVSRQHVQVGINTLSEAGLVERLVNPAHARSHLLALTDTGRRAIDSMQAREAALIDSLDLGATEADLATAARTLQAVRDALSTALDSTTGLDPTTDTNPTTPKDKP